MGIATGLGLIGLLVALISPVSSMITWAQLVSDCRFSAESAQYAVPQVPSFVLTTSLIPSALLGLFFTTIWFLIIVLLLDRIKSTKLDLSLDSLLRFINRFVSGDTRIGCIGGATLVLLLFSIWTILVVYYGDQIPPSWLLRVSFAISVVVGAWTGVLLVDNLCNRQQKWLTVTQAIALFLAICFWAGQHNLALSVIEVEGNAEPQSAVLLNYDPEGIVALNKAGSIVALKGRVVERHQDCEALGNT